MAWHQMSHISQSFSICLLYCEVGKPLICMANLTLNTNHLAAYNPLSHASCPCYTTATSTAIFINNILSNHAKLAFLSNYAKLAILSNHAELEILSNHAKLAILSNHSKLAILSNHERLAILSIHAKLAIQSNDIKLKILRTHIAEGSEQSISGDKCSEQSCKTSDNLIPFRVIMYI